MFIYCTKYSYVIKITACKLLYYCADFVVQHSGTIGKYLDFISLYNASFITVATVIMHVLLHSSACMNHSEGGLHHINEPPRGKTNNVVSEQV